MRRRSLVLAAGAILLSAVADAAVLSEATKRDEPLGAKQRQWLERR